MLGVTLGGGGTPGFSILVLDTGAGERCVVGACPVHGKILSSIPGRYSLDASSTLSPCCDNQKCLQTLQMAPGVGRRGKSHLPLLENHWLSVKVIYGLAVGAQRARRLDSWKGP